LQPSGYNDFKDKSDFQSENWIDTKSWTKKRVYDQNPYLSFADQKFNIKLGQLKPYFYAYCRQKGELFGDDIAFDLTGYTVYFYLYDSLHNLVARDLCEVTNFTCGEICYKWKTLDIQKCGFYTCELEFIDSNNLSFKLPDDKVRFEIIVGE
jgi:hypothetical protein